MLRPDLSPRAYLTVAGLVLTLGGCLEPFSAEGTTPSKAKRSAKMAAGQGPGTGAAGKQADDKQADGKKKKKQQTYAQAWQLICHAERLSGADPRDEHEVRSSKVADWISTHVKNTKARYWWIGYTKVRQSEREAYFRGEAKDAGLPSCPLAALLFPKASTSSRPSTQPSKAPAQLRP